MTKRIVGFLDILGFKEAVSAEDELQYSAIYEVLKKFADSNCKHEFNFEQPTEHSFNLAGRPATSSFSDNIVISFGDDATDISVMTLFGFIYSSVAAICDYALNQGFLVRGGITYGDIIHESNIVYGKALLEAIEIEKSVAVYPRIVLSGSLVTALQNSNDPISWAFDKSMSFPPWVLQDVDGLHYINWLSCHRLDFMLPEGVDIATLSTEERKAFLDQKLAGYKEIVDREVLKNQNDIRKYKNWYWMQKYLLDFMTSREERLKLK